MSPTRPRNLTSQSLGNLSLSSPCLSNRSLSNLSLGNLSLSSPYLSLSLSQNRSLSQNPKALLASLWANLSGTGIFRSLAL